MLSLIPFIALSVQTPTMPAEASQFDFWVGDWACEGPSYAPNGAVTQTKGSNKIRKILKGHVVQEQFESAGFHGNSISIFVPGRGWRQTWVDDSGGYIPLAGSFEDGKMTLQTLSNPAHPENVSRMIYLNITKNAFDWRWEKTNDGGKNWQLQWLLHYTRKK